MERISKEIFVQLERFEPNFMKEMLAIDAS